MFFVTRKKYKKLLKAYHELTMHAIESEARHKELRDGFTAFMREHGDAILCAAPSRPGMPAPSLHDRKGNVYYLGKGEPKT